MKFTEKQVNDFKTRTGLDVIPNGELITSGEKFDAVNEGVSRGISQGHFPKGSKLLGLADMVITDIREDRASNLDFLAVVSGVEGDVYFVDPQGVSRYTKEQVVSLRALLALA